MVMDLKHFDGSLRPIDRVPEELKRLYATAFEVDAFVAGRSRFAPPEVDRPGAVAEHLHGRRLGPQARRDLQAGLAARAEDHLLPAHHQRHLQPRSPPRCLPASSMRCRCVIRWCWCCSGSTQAALRPMPAEPASDIKFCSIDNPDCEPASDPKVQRLDVRPMRTHRPAYHCKGRCAAATTRGARCQAMLGVRAQHSDNSH